MARPSKYKDEFIQQTFKLCMFGFTDKNLAAFFGIAKSTLNQWKKKHKEFSDSLTRGKNIADAEVAASFHKRAKGYQYDEVHKKLVAGRMKIIKVITKEVPPDPKACLNWLKNKKPLQWRDKQEIKQSNKIKIIELQTRFKKSTDK